MYNYTLTGLDDPDVLFLFEGETAKKWAEAEFEERVDMTFTNPGEAWKIRQHIWEEFLNDEHQFDYTYNARFHYCNCEGESNIYTLIKELSRNPDSRQCWLPIFHPRDVGSIGGKERVPCSLGYYFMVRAGKLHLIYAQRSADAVRHWGNDIYLAWKMKEHILELVNVHREADGKELFQSGDLIHQIFSLHSYRVDWDKLDNGISNLASM